MIISIFLWLLFDDGATKRAKRLSALAVYARIVFHFRLVFSRSQTKKKSFDKNRKILVLFMNFKYACIILHLAVRADFDLGFQAIYEMSAFTGQSLTFCSGELQYENILAKSGNCGKKLFSR